MTIKGSDGRVNRIDGELFRKLKAAGMHPQKADGICQDLGRLCTKSIQGLARGSLGGSGRAGIVSVDTIEMTAEGGRRRVKYKLTCCGVTLEVNEEHYNKLKRLYERTVIENQDGLQDDDDDITEEVEEDLTDATDVPDDC